LANIQFSGLLEDLQVQDTLLIDMEAVTALLKIICDYDSKNACGSQLRVLNLRGSSFTRDGFIKIIQTINSESLEELYFGIDLPIKNVLTSTKKPHSTKGSTLQPTRCWPQFPFPNSPN
jgi:hypothetical protein